MFILRIDGSGEAASASVLHASVKDLSFKVTRYKTDEEGTALEVRTERGALRFEGRMSGPDLILGRVDGGAFKNVDFYAQRTLQERLGRLANPNGPERTAYSRARSVRDPLEKIAALRKFLRTYSTSLLAMRAYHQIFKTHLSVGSGDPTVQEAARVSIVTAEKRALMMNDVAGSLAGKGRLLDRAREYSDKALAEVPPKTRVHSQFLKTRAVIALRKKQLEQAAGFLEQALEIDPDSGEILAFLAGVWAVRGDAAKAREYYLASYINSGSPLAKAQLESFYREAHGSVDGLEETIDEAYEKRPPLFEVGSYQGPPAKSVVLVELFTGTECIPCQSADYAFDALLSHYPRASVAALQYHLHIPNPDPLTNPDSIARGAYYGVGSTPVILFDGTVRRTGGGRRQGAASAFTHYKQVVDEHLRRESIADFLLRGTLRGDDLAYQVSAKVSGSPANSDLRLHLILVEGRVRYSGYNGVRFHRNTVRKMLSGSQGVPVKPVGETGLAAVLDMNQLELELETYLKGYQIENKTNFKELVNRTDRNRLRLSAPLPRGLLANTVTSLARQPA